MMRPSALMVMNKKNTVVRESSSAAIFGNKLMKQIIDENNVNQRTSTNSVMFGGNRKFSNVSKFLSDVRKRRSSGTVKINKRFTRRALNSNVLSQKYS